MYTPGDILLVRDYSGQGDLIGNLILAGSTARHGQGFATHSACIVSPQGDLIEALEQGVATSHISKYQGKETRIVQFPAAFGDARRLFAVRFWQSCVGQPYGNLGFVSLAVSILFGIKAGVDVNKMPICSQLASRPTESMTEQGWAWPPEEMMPDDIAVQMGVLPAGAPVGFGGRVLLLFKALYWGVAPWKHGIRPTSWKEETA
jgi:hypothetical protein